MADLGLLQRLHPEWNLVDATDSPQGGVWAVNALGQVFTLDQAGNATQDSNVAGYFGGYSTLAPEQRAGTRTIQAIQRNTRGGYTLISNLPGQEYAFNDPRFAPPQGSPGTTTGPLAPGAPAPTAGDRATIVAFLSERGLGTLADKAFAKWQAGGGTQDMASILLEMRQEPEYKARFPGIDTARERARTGFGFDWTEKDYLEYESRVFQKASDANLPPGMVNRDLIGQLLTNDWSVSEWEQSVDMATQAAASTPPETLAAMRRFWDVDTGSLTAYYLDPDRATSIIEEQARLRQAGIAGASSRVGFGDISLTEAQRFQQQGLTEGQAGQAFGQAASLRGLTEELLGESEDLTRDTLLGGVVEGNATAQQKLEKRRNQRKATFEGGGGASGFGQRSGVGSAGT